MTLKKILLISLAFIFGLNFTAQAQFRKKKAAEIKRLVWPHNDPAKKIKFDADKYKDQSAVILYQKHYYNYKRRNRIVFVESYFRRRIKILDQAALDEYSKFKYEQENTGSIGILGFKKKDKEITNFNVKIIKPNKKEIKIDIKKNTVKEDDVNKIAIPNLEIGDIIDYYYFDSDYLYIRNGATFPPVYTTLNSDYPIIREEVDLNMGKKFYLNFQNLNGAPDIKKIRTSDPKRIAYKIIMDNVKSRDAKSWVFPLVEYPSIKFQVGFAPSNSVRKKMGAFLAKERGKIKRHVTKDEVLETYKTYKFNNKSLVKLYKNLKNIKSPRKRIERFYNNLRYYAIQPVLQASVFEDIDPVLANVWMNDVNLLNEYTFHSVLHSFLEHEKLKHELILVKYRKLGGMKDLLTNYYLDYVTKVYLPGGETMFLQSLVENPLFGIAGEIHPLYESNSAYVLGLSKLGKPESINDFTMPESAIEDNVIEKNMEVNLDDQFKDIAVKQTVNAKGHKKRVVRSNIVSIYDFYDDDYKRFNDGKSILHNKAKRKRGRSTINKLNAAIKKNKDKRKEAFKKDTEKYYEVKIDNYDFGIDKLGRYADQKDFQYHESYNIKEGLTKKAGKNTILLAGKLIGRQDDVDEKEMKRTENIYRYYPYIAKYHISIKLPAGYKVKGLDKLNKSVKNDVGSFISSAKQEGDKIIINVEESYFHNYEPNANWSKMVDVLKASHQFTQEKLLLRK